MQNNYKAGFVYIIIVTYNGEKWIRKCLQSLIRNTGKNSRIAIIDNCSKDKTKDIVLNEFKEIEFIPLEINKGYGLACNIGIERAYKEGAEFIVVLNQDVIVESNWLEPLIQAAKNYPELGILSPFQIKYDSNETDLDQEIILKKQLINLPGNLHLNPNIVPVRSVIGACLFFPRRTIEKVGGFDPGYFMYGEETDLCERIIYHKMYPVIVKNSVIRHYSARRDYDLSSNIAKYYFRNQYRLFLKNPHSSFAGNLYSYFRCMMFDITKRMWKQFVGRNAGIKSVFTFIYVFVSSQVQILLSLGPIYKSQKKCRNGSTYLHI